MAIDSDGSVSLPKPPPPRPAARRDAIDSALRKFDGVEPAPVPVPKRSSWAGWVPRDRRAIGAFATAAIVAVVSVPVALTTLQNDPPPSLPRPSEAPVQPQVEEAAPVTADTATPAEEQEAANSVPTAMQPAPAARSVQSPPALVSKRDQRENSIEEMAKAMQAAPAPMAAYAPSPPPPPPPAAPERDTSSEEGLAGNDIVVSGSRIGRNEAARQRSARVAERELTDSAPLAVVEARSDFLSQLQSAFRANDQRAVLALIALPLRVRAGGETVTYRTVGDVERDFDEIFTPQVKQSVLNQRADRTGRVRFGPTPGNGPIRIREVRP